MPAHQLVKLPTGRGVLVFETVGFPGQRRAQRAKDDLFINRGQFFPRAGKETGDLGKAMRDTPGGRWLYAEFNGLIVWPIKTLSSRSLAANCPQAIAQMLFDER